jgi:xanthine dehydrogenase YagR molybdenum-binding subunit
MPDYQWPDPDQRTLIGQRTARVDSPDKVSGQARYTYDVKRPGLLFGKMLRSPYAHCKIVSIDISAAEKMPGVKGIQIVQNEGSTIHWAGDDVIAVAAVDEGIADDAVRAIKVKYQKLPHLVSDAEPPAGAAESQGPLSMDDLGDMLDNQVPEREMISQIRQYGISFKPTDEDVKDAKQQGVPDAIIDAVLKATVHPQAAGAASKSNYQKAAIQNVGDVDTAFSEADAVSEGLYGAPVIVHCCMESHGSTSEWTDPDHLFVHISTQGVSGIAGQMAEPLKIPSANIHVHQDNLGGGFGSKFGPDRWGIATAQLSKKAGGKPVRLMLERDSELKVAGARPSAFARVKVGAKKDGTLVAWQSQSWGTGGPGGGGMPPIPYCFNVPNQRKEHTAIRNNIGPARAWRAPSHPQAAVLTMCALDDVAAKLNMDPYEFFLKNIELTRLPNVYREEFPIAADLIGWKAKWRPRGQNISGNLARGLGLSLHTWGGRGHASDCDLSIHPDGSVDIKMCTQDIGTGTRTCIAVVAADALGLPANAIKLYIGDTQYPPSGGSGGSTTPGGVSSSTRRAVVDARDALFAKLAPSLNAQPDELEARDGEIRVKSDHSRSLSWKAACAKIGATPITGHGHNDQVPSKNKPDLTNSGVGGVQMAEVEVDTETGIAKVTKMVAVQDCGLIIDVKMAESSVLGAMNMSISYSLYEEKVMDPISGRMLNADMEFYRLAGLNDIPELKVHMMTGKGYHERGVIGLGEPPVISGGAAISNAVANAIGTRVPFLPITPDKVLAALGQTSAQKAGA